MEQQDSLLPADACISGSNDIVSRSLTRDILRGFTTFVTVGVIVLLAYVVSAGPVIAYTCKYPHSSAAKLCQLYVPLYRTTPTSTVRYMSWWGVNDLEMYFLFCPVQHQVPDAKVPARVN